MQTPQSIDMTVNVTSSETNNIPTTPAQNKLIKKNRAANWTPPEDEQLALSWLATSTHPEHCNNQSGEVFYERVAEHFNQKSKLVHRPMQQCRIRWGVMNTDTLKYSAIYGSIIRTMPSGHTVKDYMGMANKAWQAQVGSQFKFEAAWLALMDAPKWAIVIAGPQPQSSSLITLTTQSAASSAAEGGSINASSSDEYLQTDLSTPSPRSAMKTLHPLSPTRSLGQKSAKRRHEEQGLAENLEIARVEELKKATEIQARRVAAMEQGNLIAQKALELDQAVKESQMQLTDIQVLNASEDNCADERSKMILRQMKERLAKKYKVL